MKKPTKRQKQILRYIRDTLNSGRPAPTVREISEHFGFASTRSVRDHLAALERKGCIIRTPRKARAISLPENRQMAEGLSYIPVYGRISAGIPVSETQHQDNVITLDIESLGVKKTKNMFALKVMGDSMTGRGIFDGDIIIFDPEKKPEHGDVVAALIDKESTVKTLVKRDGRIFLKPENIRHKELIPVDELRIQGTASLAIRKI